MSRRAVLLVLAVAVAAFAAMAYVSLDSPAYPSRPFVIVGMAPQFQPLPWVRCFGLRGRSGPNGLCTVGEVKQAFAGIGLRPKRFRPLARVTYLTFARPPHVLTALVTTRASAYLNLFEVFHQKPLALRQVRHRNVVLVYDDSEAWNVQNVLYELR